MPILRSAVSTYPENLFDDLGAIEGARHWWVAYTKVRQEKRLAADLTARQVPFYLPLVERRHLYRGRQLQSQVPLFGSYVFLFADPRERSQSIATNRIVQMISVTDGQQLFRDLLQVRQLIAAKMPLTVEARLRPGQRVRVRHGCMAGVEGVVEARRRKTRLIVGVTFLQRGISVEVDDCMLEPID